MASFNRVILVGNVTRDPELRYTPSGTAVTEIGLAVNDRRKGPNGDWVEETTFVDVTLWERTAEIACEYLSKGSPVLIEGRLKLDSWEKDGKKSSKLRVVGEKMQLLGSRGGGQGEGAARSEGASRGESNRGESSGGQYGGGGRRRSSAPSNDYEQPSRAPAAQDDIPF
jgi:single-strand DNA-binding protein